VKKWKRLYREKKREAEELEEQRLLNTKSYNAQHRVKDNLQVVGNLAIECLSGLNYKAVLRWESSLETLHVQGVAVPKVSNLINPLDKLTITRDLLAFVDENGRPQAWLKKEDTGAWESWPAKLLVQRLKRVYPESKRVHMASGVVARIRDKPLVFNSHNNFDSVRTYMREVDAELMKYHDDPSLAEEQDALVKVITKAIKSQTSKSAKATNLALEKMKFTSVSRLFVAIQKHLNIASIHMEKAAEYADDAPIAPATDRPSKRNRDYDKGDDQPNKTPKLTLKPPSNGGEGPVPEPEGSGPQCRKCGVRNHSPKDCKIAASGHPDINTTDNEWRDSAAGLKAWRDYGIRHLKRFKRIDGSAWNDNRDSGGKPKFLLKGAEKKQDRRNHFNKQSKSPLVHDSVACMSGGDASKDADMAYLEHLLAINNNSGIQHHTIPCEIVVNNLISLNANALIDTGALQSNYVDLKTAAAIVKAQMAAQELEERMHVASHVHTCTSCSSGSALSVLECLGCKNKVFKNNEDFLFDQPGGIDNTTKHKHKHKLRFGQVPGKTLPHTMEQETGTVSTEPLSTQPAKANSTSTDIQSLPATSAKTIITTNSNSRICTGVKCCVHGKCLNHMWYDVVRTR